MRKIILFLGLINFSLIWSFKESDFNRFLVKDCDNDTKSCNNLDLNITSLPSAKQKEINKQIQDMQNKQNAYEGQSMQLSNYQGINLDGSDFSGLDLSEFSFSGSRLRKTNFSNTKLHNTHFDNAIASGAIFDNADIDLTENFANFANTQLGSTIDGNLPPASFKNTKIKNASFQFARLDNVTFDGAEILENIKLNGANLAGTDFSKIKTNNNNWFSYISNGPTNPITNFCCTKMPYGTRLANDIKRGYKDDTISKKYTIISNEINDGICSTFAQYCKID